MVGKPLAAILLLSFVLLVHSSDPCTQPIVTGPCRAYFPSVGYNAKEIKCVEFVYGGCQGNSNRFETKEDCESKCVRKT